MSHLAKMALRELARRATLRNFAAFIKAFPPAYPYLWGRHTHGLARLLQHASETVEAGGRFYGIFVMPPRHGKSDQVSRRYPVWHLLRNPEHDVILASYGAALAEDMNRVGKNLMEEIGPCYGCHVAEDKKAVGHWRLRDEAQGRGGGGVAAVGLGGTITGRGAHVLIIDDYLKNREEAESAVAREKIWEGFRSDLMTRLAPAHAVIVAATRWHEDDLIGRLLAEPAKEPDFPRFSMYRFPAYDDKTGWLFPERFSEGFYRGQKAALASYAWEALYQGEPKPRTGNFLKADRVAYVNEMPPGLRWFRGWDPAATAAQRAKDDPDYTAGVKVAIDKNLLYIGDVRRGQWEGPKRDKMMALTSEEDGPDVRIRIEGVAGFKDSVSYGRKNMPGRIITQGNPRVDMLARASALEAYFELGHVVMLKAQWNGAFVNELLAFPRGKHDDQVAGLVTAYEEATARKVPRIEQV